MIRLASLKASLTALGDAPGLSVRDASECFDSATPGQALLHFDGRHCRAIVSLQGAQVLAYHPTQGPELLWTSPRARFQPGEPIRGGIPLCLPWFGPHPEAATRPGGQIPPKHGIARLREWSLSSARVLDNGDLALGLELFEDASAAWPHPFRARLGIRAGRSLRLELEVANTGDRDMPVSWAFHTYLAVDELERTRVEGLEGRTYLDNTRDLEPARQQATLGFAGTVDRVYPGVGGRQWLYNRHRVAIEGEGCDTVIAWNPGKELAAGMEDIGPHYREFACVERGAVFEDSWSLAPGASGRAHLILSHDSAPIAGTATESPP